MRLTKHRNLGDNEPVYIIAEMSANHAGSLEKAKEIIRAAKGAGADCVKIQTYTADTLTLNSNKDDFKIKGGLWNGETLYDLYKRASLPWEWHAELKKEADAIGIDFFSTPYDSTAVDFLEKLGVEFYKIASFEIVDIPLVKKIAQTGKPILMSTGMATKEEIQEAVDTIRTAGNNNIALLKCSSAYPAESAEMNLATIADLREKFGDVVVGFSDHSTEDVSAIIAVSLGAKIVEKHFCISRDDKSADSAFSLDKNDFARLVKNIRETEAALGKVSYGPTKQEMKSLAFRKSIYACRDIKKSEIFTEENIKVVRPSYGLHPRYFDRIIGKKAKQDIRFAEPIKEGDVDGF